VLWIRLLLMPQPNTRFVEQHQISYPTAEIMNRLGSFLSAEGKAVIGCLGRQPSDLNHLSE
jgi:hypothetical protein